MGALVEVTARDALTRLTLNRPDKANALNTEMLEALATAIEGVPSHTKVLMISGAGRVFSAGADLGEVRAGTLATSPLWERVSGAIVALSCLTIAVLNGPCAGGAMGMILACDLRIAAPHTRLFYPVVSMGVLPQPSDPGRLAALVGPARAKLILLGGARIDAPEALQFGLIDRICDDLETGIDALLEPVLSADQAHSAQIKAMIDGSVGRV